jgi:hypothetical protein
MAERSKSPVVVLLLVGCFVILLCCCCSTGLLVLAGTQGQLPDEIQDQYDGQEFPWDDSSDEYLDDYTYEDDHGDDAAVGNDVTYTEEDCDFPNGDIEYWWYEVDEETRECYRDMYGDPWFLE